MSEQRWCRAGCYWMGLFGVIFAMLLWLVKWAHGLDPTFQFQGGIMCGVLAVLVPALLIPKGWDEGEQGEGE